MSTKILNTTTFSSFRFLKWLYSYLLYVFVCVCLLWFLRPCLFWLLSLPAPLFDIIIAKVFLTCYCCYCCCRRCLVVAAALMCALMFCNRVEALLLLVAYGHNRDCLNLMVKCQQSFFPHCFRFVLWSYTLFYFSYFTQGKKIWFKIQTFYTILYWFWIIYVNWILCECEYSSRFFLVQLGVK